MCAAGIGHGRKHQADYAAVCTGDFHRSVAGKLKTDFGPGVHKIAVVVQRHFQHGVDPAAFTGAGIIQLVQQGDVVVDDGRCGVVAFNMYLGRVIGEGQYALRLVIRGVVNLRIVLYAYDHPVSQLSRLRTGFRALLRFRCGLRLLTGLHGGQRRKLHLLQLFQPVAGAHGGRESKNKDQCHYLFHC